MKKILSSRHALIYVLFAVSVLLLSSCEKHIEIDEPADRLLTSDVFTDSINAESAVVGLYLQQNTFITAGFYSVLGTLSGYVTLLPALCADELQTIGIGAYQGFAVNEISENNSDNYTNWGNAYNIIYHANAVIESLERSSSLGNEFKERLSAEAKFIRAINFFYLSAEYGNIPMPLTTDYKINAAIASVDTAVIFKQVIDDLQQAKELLPAGYPGTGEKIRANKYAAIALLARVHLYRKDYMRAENEAGIIINDGGYDMVSASETFTPNNQEAILQFAPTNSFSWNTPDGGIFLSSDGYALTNELLDAFEDNDSRKEQWTRTFTVNGSTFYSPYKYKNYYKMAGKEYNIVLRLAEQYLIRAEARAQLNMLNGAIEDLDKVRYRAGLPLVATVDPNISASDLITAVWQEKRIEFFVEWGHRWFDLKRTGLADAVLTSVKGETWQATDILFPVPQQEIMDNPSLQQNDGYKR